MTLEVRHALIIATARYYDPKLQQLRAPAADAGRLAAVLSDPARGNFVVDVLLDETHAKLTREIASFFRDRHPSDLLLLHFSCHGVKDDRGELYMAASDTELDLLSATGVSAAWLNDQISRTRSRRTVVFLDCCFSGAFPFGMRARAGDAIDAPNQLDGRGRAIITASSGMEYAYEGDQLTGKGQPSVFTEAIVEGLETGKADLDRDQLVSIDDLYTYVYDRVRARTPSQTPNKKSEIEGPLYLARSSYRPEIEPATLDPNLLARMEDRYAGIRVGAAEELAKLLGSRDPAVALAATQALSELTEDDSRQVSERARRALVKAQQHYAEKYGAPPLAAQHVETEPTVHTKADQIRQSGPHAANVARTIGAATRNAGQGALRSRGAVALAGICGVLVVAVAVASLTNGGDSPSPPTEVPVRIRLGGSLPRNAGPHVLAVDETHVWVAEADGTLERITPGHNYRQQRFDVEGHGDPYGVATNARGGVWVSDTRRGTVVAVPANPDARQESHGLNGVEPMGIASSKDRSVYLIGRTAQQSHQLVQYSIGKPLRATPLRSLSAMNLAISPDSGVVWISDQEGGRVIRFDPTNGQMRCVAVSSNDGRTASPGGLAVDRAGRLWVADSRYGRVIRLGRDSALKKDFTETFVPVGKAPTGVAVSPREGADDDERYVWVTNSGDGTVSRIRQAKGMGKPTATTTQRVDLTAGPRPIAVAARGHIAWVANAGDDTLSRLTAGESGTTTSPKPFANSTRRLGLCQGRQQRSTDG